MGIAVAVTVTPGRLETAPAMNMPGIGLAALALWALGQK